MSNQITSIAVRPIAGCETRGLKNRMFVDALGGVDVFTGPNGSGKTTRILALMGAIGGLASTTTDQRRPYLGDPPEGVEVEVCTTGGSWTRDLGVVRANASAHKRATAEAHRIVGAPVVSWNLSDWSNATDGGRRKLLADIARAGGVVQAWTAQDAIGRLSVIMDGVDTGPDVMDVLTDTHPTAADAAVWLDAAEVWAEAEGKRARAALRDAEAILKERTESMPPKPAVEASITRFDLDDARQQLAALRSAAADVQRHQAKIEVADTELRNIAARGAQLKAQPAPAPPTDDELRAIDKQLTEALAEREKTVPPPPDAPQVDQRLRDDVVAKARVVADAKATWATANAERSEAESAYDAGRAKWATYNAEKAVYDAMAANADGVCVHCGGADPLGVLAGVEAPTAPESMVEVNTQRDAALRAYTEAHRAQTRAEQDLAVARAALARAEGAASSAIRESTARTARIVQEREDAVVRLERAKSGAVARLQSAQAHHTAAIERRTADLARLRADYGTVFNRSQALKATTVEAVDPQRLVDLTAKIERLQAAADAHRDYDRAVESLRRAGEALTAADVHRKATSHLIEGIRAVRLQQAAACYRPIEDAARGLLADAWSGAPMPYLNGPADYGAIVRGVQVRFEALSESEQRITAAAMVYALAVVSAQPCRLVLIDGYETIQPDHRAPLMAALVRAQNDGLVDNVIVTFATSEDPTRAVLELPDVAVPGVTIHRLEY